MQLNKLHIAVLSGLLCGIVVCNGSSENPVYSAPTKRSGIQVPYKPTWIPLAPIVTDLPTNDTPTIAPPIIDTANVEPVNTTHTDLLSAAGIELSDHADAEWLIAAESSWNPYAVEPTTGACHLEQSLPCGKDGCNVADTICQLNWTRIYIASRYGSWSNAVSFHKVNNYY